MERKKTTRRVLFAVGATTLFLGVTGPAQALRATTFRPGPDRLVLGGTGEIVPEPTPVPPFDLPEPTPESLAKPSISIGERGPHELTIEWCDRSSIDEGNRLYRSRNGESFAFVRDLGPSPRGCRSDVDDGLDLGESGLEPDTEYCYFIGPVKDFAEWADYRSVETCAYTREVVEVDGSEVRRPVWRVQLELRTANAKNAGTDSPINVSLNAPFVGYAYRDTIPVRRPFGNNTWLDYGGDDRERGTTEIYDLNLTDVSEIGDITRIAFKQNGKDRWCLDGFSVIVNGEAEVFRKDFSSCLRSKDWGDLQVPFLVVDHEELRSHPLWHEYVPRLVDDPLAVLAQLSRGEIVEVLRLSRGELESRIEGLVGHKIRGKLDWGHLNGPRYVEISRDAGDTSRASVDLDLEAPITGSNPEVDIDFVLRFAMACREDLGGIDFTIQTENFAVEADATWLTKTVGWLWCQVDASCKPAVESFIEEEVGNQLTPIAQQLGLESVEASAVCALDFVPVARVMPDGGLAIEIHPGEDEGDPDPNPYGPVRNAHLYESSGLLDTRGPDGSAEPPGPASRRDRLLVDLIAR